MSHAAHMPIIRQGTTLNRYLSVKTTKKQYEPIRSAVKLKVKFYGRYAIVCSCEFVYCIERCEDKCQQIAKSFSWSNFRGKFGHFR